MISFSYGIMYFHRCSGMQSSIGCRVCRVIWKRLSETEWAFLLSSEGETTAQLGSQFTSDPHSGDTVTGALDIVSGAGEHDNFSIFLLCGI
jgi:hypothetical protein